MKTPTTDELLGIIESAKNKIFSQMMSDFNEKRSFYNSKFSFKYPLIATPHRPPTATTKIDKGSEQMITDRPQINFEASDTSEKAEQQRDNLQRFGEFCFREWELQNDMPPLRECGKNLCLYGAMCLKLMYARSLDFPLVLRAIDPMTMFPLGNIQIQSHKRLAIEIEEDVERFNEGKKSKIAVWERKGGLFEPLEWTEVWHNDWRCFFVEKEPLFKQGVQPNVYGFKPYSYRYSGWGKSSPDGKPEEKAVGIIDKAMGSLRAQAMLQTAFEFNLMKDVYGRYAMTRDASEKVEWPSEIGDPVIMENKEDVWAMEHLAIHPDMLNLLSLVKSDIDASTFYAPLGGGRTPGTYTVGQAGMEIGQGRLMFRTPRKQMELMTEDIMRKACLLIKNVHREPLTLYGKRRISPDDIIPPIFVKVNLEPTDPERDAARIRIGSEMMVRGQISWTEFARNYARVKDITSERKMILIDKILTDPVVIATMGAEALEKWGMREVAEALGGMEQERKRREFTESGIYPKKLGETTIGGGEPRGSQYEEGKVAGYEG